MILKYLSSYFVNWDGESNFKFVKRGFTPLKKQEGSFSYIII